MTPPLRPRECRVFSLLRVLFSMLLMPEPGSLSLHLAMMGRLIYMKGYPRDFQMRPLTQRHPEAFIRTY